jgi:hypothetical protein
VGGPAPLAGPAACAGARAAPDSCSRVQAEREAAAGASKGPERRRALAPTWLPALLRPAPPPARGRAPAARGAAASPSPAPARQATAAASSSRPAPECSAGPAPPLPQACSTSCAMALSASRRPRQRGTSGAVGQEQCQALVGRLGLHQLQVDVVAADGLLPGDWSLRARWMIERFDCGGMDGLTHHDAPRWGGASESTDQRWGMHTHVCVRACQWHVGQCSVSSCMQAHNAAVRPCAAAGQGVVVRFDRVLPDEPA